MVPWRIMRRPAWSGEWLVSCVELGGRIESLPWFRTRSNLKAGMREWGSGCRVSSPIAVFARGYLGVLEVGGLEIGVVD